MIKKLLLFFLIMFSMLKTVSANELRSYEVETYKEFANQLSEASKNNFPVFVYIHADWCYVCGYMDRDIWSQKKVVSELNKTFLNLNIDITNMTKEKNKILKHLKVDSTPAYFFYDKNGTLKHRQGGYMIADELIEQSAILK